MSPQTQQMIMGLLMWVVWMLEYILLLTNKTTKKKDKELKRNERKLKRRR